MRSVGQYVPQNRVANLNGLSYRNAFTGDGTRRGHLPGRKRIVQLARQYRPALGIGADLSAEQGGKVAGSKPGRRHRVTDRYRIVLPVPFVTKEEEGLITPSVQARNVNWPAQCHAELVA